MESTPEMVRSKIWVLRSEATSVSDNFNLAGALCVDKSGLLMTTIFGICPRTKSVSRKKVVRYLSKPEEFRVQAYDCNNRQWDVKLVYKCTEFGILFYQVINCEAVFDFVNLDTDNQKEFSSKNMFAYLHHNSLRYSRLSAIESYAFPPDNLVFPNDVSDVIVGRLPKERLTSLYFETMDCNPPYRMVENTIDLESCNKGNVGADGLVPDTLLPRRRKSTSKPPNPDHDILPEAVQLYTKLPLLQLSGLECDMHSGSSGCPVFKIENNELVGLMLFNLNSSCFAVPLSVLRHCFKKSVREQRAGRGGKGGGGGGKGQRRRKGRRAIGGHG